MNPEDSIGSQLGSGSVKMLPKPVIIGLMAFAGIVGLVILLIILSALRGTPEGAGQLAQVARQQARILQVAEAGVQEADSQEAKNLAITVQLSLLGDQPALLAALEAQNIRASTGEDPELSQMLVTARQANRFDEVVTEYLQTELTSYARNLGAAYQNVESQSLRNVLQTQYRNAQLLAGGDATEGASQTE